MNSKEYFMGFDIGTGSVGWAVTDLDYNLIKINRKPAWGTVLFETSEGAETRRLNRCARRRWKREKERLALLRELFEEEMYKVDPGFFQRLQESRYYPEDKRDENGEMPQLPYALFVDKGYTDVEYHQEFPTIYHLRKALMTEEGPFDIRLVYLAIAHILKHRGHFLSNMGSGETNVNLCETLVDLKNCWNSNIAIDGQTQLSFSEKQIEEVEDILKDVRFTKSMKKQKILELMEKPEKQWKELVALICGGKVSISKLFERAEYENLEESKICFDESSYEDKEEYYATNLGDDYEIIEKAKQVYDSMVLSNILKGDTSGHLSFAKVADYEKHKKDLRILKEAILNDGIGGEKDRKEVYKRVFGMPLKGEKNYSVYVGRVSFNGKKRVFEEKACIKADFYKFLEKHILPCITDGDRKQYIQEQISIENFMPKAKVKENAVVPYQMHEKELRKILENAELYLPFLKEKDETNKTVSEKIMLLLTFRIPYYVGPVNNAHQDKWAARNENETGKITPWNFEQKINLAKSAEAFITRMTSKCTYLKEENVLPKCSLLYEKFMVLNEINKLKIKGEPISVEVKKNIYTNVFEKNSRVTLKKIVDYLRREEGYVNLTKDEIDGVDIEIKSSLKSYHAFKQKFTDSNLSEVQKEDVIRDMTLFGAEPKLLKQRLLVKYPNYEKQLTDLIKSLKCNEWGRLSYKLLNGIENVIPETGMAGTVICAMWETNLNLMELVGRKDSLYALLIEQENGVKSEQKLKYEMIDSLYVSPSVKRQIWKATQVLDEITKAMGHAPKRVFVEMTREHGETKRSVTRKDQLLDLYRNIKEEKALFEQLKSKENDKLRSDKLFLYFTQLGRCAYTGKEIRIEDLADKNLYDIDHIYPQSKTADDSIDNRVLVCKKINMDKTDIYPLSSEVRNKMQPTWLMWKQKGLISDKKYQRLIRTTELTNEELTGFINRQLVETSQSTKEFIGVLKQILPQETEIVYSKAGNVARFRSQYDILKVRELNDLHHAKDAYLNIVVGNVYHLKFTKDTRKYFLEKGTYRTYNLNRMFDYDVEFAGEIAWRSARKDNGDKDAPAKACSDCNKQKQSGTICVVKKTLESDKILVTKQLIERKGQLFHLQPLKKGNGQVPLKSGVGNERLDDISKYGGYNSATISYYTLVEGKDKKGKKYSII